MALMDVTRASRFPFVPTATPPLRIDRTEGVWLITTDGHRILDAGAGAVVTNIGHGRPEVVEAATSALSKLD